MLILYVRFPLMDNQTLRNKVFASEQMNLKLLQQFGLFKNEKWIFQAVLERSVLQE